MITRYLVTCNGPGHDVLLTIATLASATDCPVQWHVGEFGDTCFIYSRGRGEVFVTLNIYIIASVDNNTTVTNSRSLNVEYTDAEKKLLVSLLIHNKIYQINAKL